MCAALIVSGIGIWFHFGICFISNEQFEQQAVVIQRQKEINLFDQVVFRVGTGDQSQTYLCRVVGLPGDSMWQENNSIFINHSLEETIRISPQNKADELPTGTLALKMSDNSLAQELGTFENLPQHNYLLLSDDVDNLNDSRSFGTIPRRNIEGVVLF
ncbi:signal peptidase I [Enterococcus sp. LJL120]